MHSGYTIEFTSVPPPISPFPPPFGGYSHEKILKQEVESLLQQGAIEWVPFEYQMWGFHSMYFLVSKKKSSWRPVLDPCHLNSCILRLKFQMVILASIIPSLEKDMVFSSWYERRLHSHGHPPRSWAVSQIHAPTTFVTEYSLLLPPGSLPRCSL